MRTGSVWNRLLRVTVLALGTTVISSAWMLPAAADNKTAAGSTAKAEAAAGDRVILKSGTIVEGRILEETATQIVMMVTVRGIEAKTTYAKSEISEIKRGVVAVATKAAATDAAKTGLSIGDKSSTETTTSAEEDPTLTRLYLAELKGIVGLEVSQTPIAELFEEADKYFNDLVPSGIAAGPERVVDPAKRDRNLVVVKLDLSPGIGDDVFNAENLAPAFKEQIVDKGRRVVFWIKLAGGAGAFIPWISPEIYFTEEGLMGGGFDYESFNVGDKMVNEKQISLRLGHAEGFVIKGGYGDHVAVMRAMFRSSYWLAVKFEGGKPIYKQEELDPATDGEGWTILSDDGKGKNKDSATSLKGNDLLSLNSEWAEKLGISKGTAETIDDLAFKLGVQRHYKAIEENKAQDAIKDWKEGIIEALRMTAERPIPALQINQPGKLIRELNEQRSTGDFEQRKKARGRQIALLQQIRAIIQQYKEVLDTGGQRTANIDLQISNLRLEAEQDAKNERSRGGQR